LLFALTRFIAGDSSPGDLLLVEPFDSSPGFLGIGHFNEPKASGPTGFAIHDDADASHLAILTERLLDLVFRSAEGKIAYINIRH